MVLSRIALDKSDPEVRRALAAPQVLHAVIEGCFDGKETGERRLWRLDELGGQMYLLLQSEGAPSRAPFDAAAWQTRQYDAFLSSLRNGQTWRFRLCANPVRSIAEADRPRGKVMAHVTVAQQKDWLLKRAERCGFSISRQGEAPAVEVTRREVRKFLRRGEMVTLGIAEFEGILEVRDAEAFVCALQTGIGRAKAYGCGLLTLTRV